MLPTDTLMLVVRILVFISGLVVVIGTLISAVKTFVLPRGVNVWLTRWIFRLVGGIFRLRARKAKSYEERDRIMALFAPLTLAV